MLLARVEADPLRSLRDVTLELDSGITSLVGPNGAGKTNFLEAVYFALTGRSFRTRDRRELIPFGDPHARSRAFVEDSLGARRELLASVSRADGRRHLLDGAPATPAELRRARPPVAVFAPDRLVLIKGPPAERRSHIDGFVAARWPSRSDLRRDFGRALAQRNALLSRIAAGYADPAQLETWDQTLAAAAVPLMGARADAVAELAGHFARFAEGLGLEGDVGLRYAPRAAGGIDAFLAGLDEHRSSDLKLGRSSWGPHLDEIAMERDSRSIRRYGSQGQQRMALLSLLLAEREALMRGGAETPLMILDDVMSELDPDHREQLGTVLSAGGQTLISAAAADSLPSSSQGQTVRIRSGAVIASRDAA